jgi:DNA-binding NtrC family response regulator
MNLNSSEITVLIVDDVPANLSLMRSTIESEGYRILGAKTGADALRIAGAAIPDVIMLDVMMPGMDGYEVCRKLKAAKETQDIPVIFVTMKDDQSGVAEGFRAGGVDYIPKPFEREEVLLRLRTHLELRRLSRDLSSKNDTLEAQALELKSLVVELKATNQQLHDEINNRQLLESSLAQADEQISRLSSEEENRWGMNAFIGNSQAVESVLDDVRKLHGAERTSVLITGESGTGKELIARAIHYGGENSRNPFVAVNCSAIPAGLAESIFFGHVRGSFSGAHSNQKGYFEQADGGTLFLDEIGDMPFGIQAKLLRVLETNAIQAVGSTKAKPIRVRVLTATNQDLSERIARKRFRQDLYFRLAGFIVNVPPLRERVDDIGLISQHFLGLLCREMGKELAELSSEAMGALEAYGFPGNVRELKNIIEHALIKSGGRTIEVSHLQLLDWRPVTGAKLVSENDDDLVDAEKWEQSRERVIRRAKKKPTDSDADEVESETTLGTNEEKILSFLEEHESISNTECRDLLSIDLNQASYILRKLCSYGLLKTEGERRWRRYRLALPIRRS